MSNSTKSPRGAGVVGTRGQSNPFCIDYLWDDCSRPYCRFLHGTREESELFTRTRNLSKRLQQQEARRDPTSGMIPFWDIEREEAKKLRATVPKRAPGQPKLAVDSQQEKVAVEEDVARLGDVPDADDEDWKENSHDVIDDELELRMQEMETTNFSQLEFYESFRLSAMSREEKLKEKEDMFKSKEENLEKRNQQMAAKELKLAEKERELKERFKSSKVRFQTEEDEQRKMREQLMAERRHFEEQLQENGRQAQDELKRGWEQLERERRQFNEKAKVEHQAQEELRRGREILEQDRQDFLEEVQAEQKDREQAEAQFRLKVQAKLRRGQEELEEERRRMNEEVQAVRQAHQLAEAQLRQLQGKVEATQREFWQQAEANRQDREEIEADRRRNKEEVASERQKLKTYREHLMEILRRIPEELSQLELKP